MSTGRRLTLLAAAVGLLAGGMAGHGAEAPRKAKAEAADEELLEFLGNVDDGEDDPAWDEWLTRNDPAKAGKVKGKDTARKATS